MDNDTPADEKQSTKQNRRRSGVVMASLTFLAVCIVDGLRSGDPAWRLSQQDDIYEAVFRYQIGTHVNSRDSCFLRIDDGPPSAKFLRSLKNSPAIVSLDGKQWVGVIIGPAGWVGPVSRGPTLRFWIDRIHWYSNRVAVVDGGGAASVESGDFGKFFVIRGPHGRHTVGYRLEGMF